MHIISGDLWAGAEVQAYTLIKHLKPEVELCVILMNKGELSEKLSTLGIHPVIIDEALHGALGIVSRLFNNIRQFKPDVIHTHRQKENILGSFANLVCSLVSWNLIPSIRTAHGAPEFHPKGKQKIQVFLDRLVGRFLQKGIIAVSKDLAAKLAALYPAESIHLVYNGADVAALKSSAQIADFKSAHPMNKHIGIIGRIEPVKRIDIFLELAHQLLSQPHNDDLLFHVIGDGKLRSNMENRAGTLGIQDKVHFHGHRTDIPSCIVSLDGIVMCSDHEGTPMTALEAMILGTPLIAHSVGGLKELLEGQRQHYLTENHTANSYAALVSKALETNQRAVDFPTTITAEHNATETLKIYQLLVKN
jgi:L-malate glycosyltransferase